MKKAVIATFLILFLIVNFATFNVANATEVFTNLQTPTTPSFPNCAFPQGELVVKFEDGIHGIPGDFTTHTGSDAVFQVSEEAVTQCYCTANGDGIQTNWWKVSSLTLDQIEYLQKQGWIYIPDGSVWGLANAPYLAQNITFSCGEAGSGGGEDNGGSSHHHHNGHSGGEILGLAASTALGTGGEILGLAATGNLPEILITLGLGIFAIATGVFLLNKRTNSNE